jgi:hypothetical protein
MSETYRQQAFGQPTFIDEPASGNSSGRDHFDMLDAANLFHDNYQSHRGQPLQIPAPDGYQAGHQYGYASHSSGVTLPGKRFPLFNGRSTVLHMSATRDPRRRWYLSRSRSPARGRTSRFAGLPHLDDVHLG